MRLGRSVLQNLEGTDIFAIIGFIIFFTFFILVIIYVVKMKKAKVEEYGNMPLENDDYNPGEDDKSSDN
jgi:hypothetical protein